MDMLKKLFPLSFKFSNDVANLIIGIIIYVIFAVIVGALIALANFLVGWIPLAGDLIALALKLVSSLIEIYVLAGIVILVLSFTKVLKD